MNAWSPTLNRPMTETDLEAVVADAARVLEQVGVGCTHPPTLKLLAEQEQVSHNRDGRVFFKAGRVSRFIHGNREAAARAPETQEPPFSLGACWMGLNYCDPETGQVRPATSAEAARMARFWDARGINWCIPVNPGDVPPGLTTLAGERIAVKNSRLLGGFLTVLDPEEVRYLIEMFAAAGRTYRLNEQVGISPLRFNDEGLETAFRFMGRSDVKVILSGSIPMAGATCALDPRTAMVQSLAESAAQDILCLAFKTARAAQLGIDPADLQVGGGLLRVEAFDFQYSTIVWGSPEWCLFHSLMSQLREYLGARPGRTGFFRTIAKGPDAQAQCERTASVLWQALLGARTFSGVGQICIDEVFSPQQVILDGEILKYVERVIRGLDLTQSAADPVALIREGIAEGSFLGVTDTVTRYREFFTFPGLFRHWNLGRWRGEGAPGLLTEAWQRAQEVIKTSDFRLTDEQERQVDAVYERAARYINERDAKGGTPWK